PISDFAFSEKTPVVENPGTIQTVDITPLKFNTIYYFAIKTSDGLNISQLSNIIDYSAGAPPTLMKSIWPVFQKNQQSTGFVPYGGPGFISSESVTIRLVAELPNPIYVSFVMDTDGILYAGGEKGLYAIDSRNGELKWFYDTYNYERGWGGTSYSAVLASDGTVYFTFYGGTYLYALTPTGKLKWKYRVGGPNDGGSNPIIGSDGTIYVSGREQGYLYAINPDGTEKWKYLISGANVVSSPVMGSDETIYVAWRNFGFVGYVTAIDSEGNLRWQSENVNPDTYAGLSVDTNDNIYVGSNYYHVGYLRSLRPADGAENWSSAPWGRINVPANIDGNGVIYAVNESGNIFFLNPDRTLSGAIYVANQILKPIIIGVDGVIYLVSGKKIFAFYPDGTEKWSYEFTEEIMASPIIDESGTIYISTRDGKVWAIGE
ncbi:MAG: PQQ-binding-like beta-propeller repeat protein, partial [bacterium]|nr:PQQ-binding-like beta-propeller repeat protein [bacterium]